MCQNQAGFIQFFEEIPPLPEPGLSAFFSCKASPWRLRERSLQGSKLPCFQIAVTVSSERHSFLKCGIAAENRIFPPFAQWIHAPGQGYGSTPCIHACDVLFRKRLRLVSGYRKFCNSVRVFSSLDKWCGALRGAPIQDYVSMSTPGSPAATPMVD